MEARTRIKGLPHRMPHPPAHSNANWKAARATSSAAPAKVTDIRFMVPPPTFPVKVEPSSVGWRAKLPPIRIAKKEMAVKPVEREAKPRPTTSSKPFSIEKVSVESLPTYRIPKRRETAVTSKTIQPSSDWRHHDTPRAALMAEIRRREARSDKLRALLREEDEDIDRLRRISQQMS